MDAALCKKIEERSKGSVSFACSLARYSSFAIGGPADALVVVKDLSQLLSLLQLAKEEKLPWRVIGKGSNLLISDVGFRGLVLILGDGFKEIVVRDKNGGGNVLLQAGAGCSLTKLNHYCARQGYGGLTFSYGIPGSVGGAVRMNAGAWGKEIASRITAVDIATAKGVETLTAEQLDFGYRSWPYFKRYSGVGVIARVLFSLTPMDNTALEDEMKLLLQKRKSIQPHNYPNGGSCFKNPLGKSAGQLIEECGLKGDSLGGAMVSEKHANFIVNYNKATAADVLGLVARIQQKVWSRYNINLEPEIHVM